jgi:putative membrane protein
MTALSIITVVFVALVAGMHLYFLYMEMFAWTTLGKKTFRMLDPNLFEKTKVLAANQGLYNGFLAMGLFWSLTITDIQWSQNVALFFLGCVVVAGIFGWITVHFKLFLVQGIPALIPFLLILWEKYS